MQAIPHWRSVLDHWFPIDLDPPDAERHRAQFAWWFRGGSNASLPRLAPIFEAARAGVLDHWRADPHGCLALVLLLDQFPRGLFPDSPTAYATDAQALEVVREGFRAGHYAALRRPWEQTFFLIGYAHPEGPDHLARMERVVPLARIVALQAPAPLRPLYRHSAEQAQRHRDVIARFGRFPHRNAVLDRTSTTAEAAYVAAGEFVHERPLPAT